MARFRFRVVYFEVTSTSSISFFAFLGLVPRTLRLDVSTLFLRTNGSNDFVNRFKTAFFAGRLDWMVLVVPGRDGSVRRR